MIWLVFGCLGRYFHCDWQGSEIILTLLVDETGELPAG